MPQIIEMSAIGNAPQPTKYEETIERKFQKIGHPISSASVIKAFNEGKEILKKATQSNVDTSGLEQRLYELAERYLKPALRTLVKEVSYGTSFVQNLLSEPIDNQASTNGSHQPVQPLIDREITQAVEQSNSELQAIAEIFEEIQKNRILQCCGNFFKKIFTYLFHTLPIKKLIEKTKKAVGILVPLDQRRLEAGKKAVESRFNKQIESYNKREKALCIKINAFIAKVKADGFGDDYQANVSALQEQVKQLSKVHKKLVDRKVKLENELKKEKLENLNLDSINSELHELSEKLNKLDIGVTAYNKLFVDFKNIQSMTGPELDAIRDSGFSLEPLLPKARLFLQEILKGVHSPGGHYSSIALDCLQKVEYLSRVPSSFAQDATVQQALASRTPPVRALEDLDSKSADELVVACRFHSKYDLDHATINKKVEEYRESLLAAILVRIIKEDGTIQRLEGSLREKVQALSNKYNLFGNNPSIQQALSRSRQSKKPLHLKRK
jgi:hypothetical protein